jgi:hypothetical protein
MNHAIAKVGVLLLCALGIVACDGVLASGSKGVSNSSEQTDQCRIPEVSEDFSNAICSADFVAVQKKLFELDAEARPGAARSFGKLWLEDPSFGKSIPWAALRSQSFKLTYGSFLAQSVRNGRVDFDLEHLRSFARRVASSEQHTADEIEAIRLLGYADSTDDIPLLLGKIAANPAPAEAGRSAVASLGYICDAKASDALRQLAQAEGMSEFASAVTKAVAVRKSLERDWCRRK